MKLRVPPILDTDGLPLFSLLELNRLPVAEKEKIYRNLIPEEIFRRFGIDELSRADGHGRGNIRFICPEGLGLLRIDIRLHPDDRDSLFFVEIADTHYRQMELSFCFINDPSAPRFDIDRDRDCRDNLFGTVRRNIPEERKAMAAGLAPNQVRRGLGIFSDFFRRLEHFVAGLGIESILTEPLSYDNAVRYETYGFDYITGKQLMLWIDREFRPGGVLLQRLDGSTSFRRPGMDKSVRGRSWAIHDGILGRPWDGIRIYKTPGIHAEVDTFPDRNF